MKCMRVQNTALSATDAVTTWEVSLQYVMVQTCINIGILIRKRLSQGFVKHGREELQGNGTDRSSPSTWTQG